MSSLHHPKNVAQVSPRTRRPLRRAERRGVAATEFAIVAPLLVLLCFGLIEFGRMVQVQQVLTNAAREGARTITPETTTTTGDATAAVNSYLQSAGITGATVTYNPSTITASKAGDEMQCSVSVQFNNVSWIPTPMFLSGTTLTGVAVMRREGIKN